MVGRVPGAGLTLTLVPLALRNSQVFPAKTKISPSPNFSKKFSSIFPIKFFPTYTRIDIWSGMVPMLAIYMTLVFLPLLPNLSSSKSAQIIL